MCFDRSKIKVPFDRANGTRKSDGRSAPRPDGGKRVETWPGNAYPLGATFDGSGTNFAIFSEVAERVELCLFDE